jgi:predicted nucleic acid-binding protein
MTVVADSSPLNYLILIDHTQILPKLFRQVLVPEGVFRELQNPGTPSKTALWIADRPDWLVVQKPVAIAEDAALGKLGVGEREAITLSLQYRPGVILLIDDGKGRREASRLQIRAFGLLGILDMAATRSLIDLPNTIERLIQTSFYVTPMLLKTLLERDADRRKSAPPPRRN